jgi:hypothetical protein
VSVETIVSQLRNLKTKFVAMQIQAFGLDLVRPGDQSFELRRAEAMTDDLLRLTLAINPELGPDPRLLMISVREPKNLKVTADSITIDAARAVRFEERTFTALGGGKLRATESGEEDSTAQANGPALVLS